MKSGKRKLVVVRNGALLALVIAQAWSWSCAQNDDTANPLPSEPDASALPDAPAPDTSPPLDSSSRPSASRCTAAYCRIPLAGTVDISLNGVFARATNDVWLVGSAGFAAHFDGAAWTPLKTSTNQALFSVWAPLDASSSAASPVWGTNTGNSFFMLNRPNPDGGVITRFDGGWNSVLTAVAGHTDEAWAVGSISSDDPFGEVDPMLGDNIWHFEKAKWKASSPPCPAYGTRGCVPLHAIWVESLKVQWFAGENGKVYRTDDRPDAGVYPDAGADRKRLVELDSKSLRAIYGVWGSSAADVWAVGDQGSIRRFKNGSPEAEVVASPVTSDLRAVFGFGANDIWAAGADGVILHSNETECALVPPPFGETNRPRLYSISGAAADDVWIAGESTLLRSAGKGGQP